MTRCPKNNNTRQSKMSVHATVLMAGMFLLSGCVSMQGVKTYTTYSRATIETVNPVAKDFYDSCLRANSYRPFKYRNDCITEAKASKAILAIASVLDGYGAALDALASDELVDYSTDITALSNEIADVGRLDTEKVQAVENLTSVIANAAAGAYRQEQIARFIRQSDTAVGMVSQTLADLIITNYARAVSLEIDAWESHYKQMERKANRLDPIAWEAYATAQWHQRAALQAKLDASRSLAASVMAIGLTHHKLKRDAENLTGQEVYAAVRSFFDTAKPAIDEVREAFSKDKE